MKLGLKSQKKDFDFTGTLLKKKIKKTMSVQHFYSGLPSLKWCSIRTLSVNSVNCVNLCFDQYTYLDQYSTPSGLSYPVPWSWTMSNPKMRLYFCMSHLKFYTFLQNKKSDICSRFSCICIILSLTVLSCRICKDIVKTDGQRRNLLFVVITVGKWRWKVYSEICLLRNKTLFER